MSPAPVSQPRTPVTAPLVVIEGLDGVGKTTLSRALARALDAQWRTTPGEEIRSVREAFESGLTGSRAARSLGYAATVISEGNHARALTRSGVPVVLDRYWLSTRVYAPADARAALDSVERLVPPADLTLYVWAPESVRRARLQARGLTAEDERTLAEGTALDRAFRARRRSRIAGTFHILDARRSPADVLGQAIFAVLGAGFSPRVHSALSATALHHA